MKDNIIFNQWFLRRNLSEILFGNTDDCFGSDWELVLSSSVIQLRGGITWSTHVPHARVHDWLLLLHGCVAISRRSWSEGGRWKAWRNAKSYLGRVPAGQQHVFTTASFEYKYRDPIYAAEFLKLSKTLSFVGCANMKEIALNSNRLIEVILGWRWNCSSRIQITPSRKSAQFDIAYNTADLTCVARS